MALVHSIGHRNSSVLSLAVDAALGLVFTGTQAHCIFVWRMATYELVARLHGHTAAVLALASSEPASAAGSEPVSGHSSNSMRRDGGSAARHWLFSSSGDNTVRIWDASTLTPLYVVHPCDDNVGDIYALRWCEPMQMLFLGCQNTSIHWIQFQGIHQQSRTPACTKHRDPPPDQALSLSRPASPSPNLGLPERRPNKFFDSRPPSPPAPVSPNAPDPQALRLAHESMVPAAHLGYIYALDLIRGGDGGWILVSGSGDEQVKLWSVLQPSLEHPWGGLEYLHALSTPAAPPEDDRAVLALASWTPAKPAGKQSATTTLFAARQGGQVDVWDLETRTLLRSLPAGGKEKSDVLALTAAPPGREEAGVYAASADGWVRHFDARFHLAQAWKAHAGTVLCADLVLPRGLPPFLLTGGDDSLLKVWLPAETETGEAELQRPSWQPELQLPSERDSEAYRDLQLTRSLAAFVAFPSVSAGRHHASCTGEETAAPPDAQGDDSREACRQAALWLKSLLADLGAHGARLVSAGRGRNPVVLAMFRANKPGVAMPKRVFFYGHYDVISAPKRGGGSSGWSSDPFTLRGADGYLYARGASDNKGPVLATVYAAAAMASNKSLPVDVVVCVEGEEERGSPGLQEAVRSIKEQVGPIDVILLANSYWLGEDLPCLTVGLRGVVQASLTIEGRRPDVHSGVEGGAVREPMIDMISLLAKTTSGSEVAVPHFYDHVRPVGHDEETHYASIAALVRRSAPAAPTAPMNSTYEPQPRRATAQNMRTEDLIARWRCPTLSVHTLFASGPNNNTVIPNRVRASVSVRLVPDQSLAQVVDALTQFWHDQFLELHSPNHLAIQVDHTADWWDAQTESPYFLALRKAVGQIWQPLPKTCDLQVPVAIREGGSIPAIALLEQELGATAVHLPMGQASDAAHLADERIRSVNLFRGRDVVTRFFDLAAAE